MRKTLWIFLFLFSLSLSAQTVGTLVYEDGIQEGYTFFSPFSGTKAYLIDNCGRQINSWDRGTRPGLAAYFLDNGLMFRTYKPDPMGPFTSASNSGGVELVDWDNNTVWQFEWNTPTQISHHDALYMPNGHVLLLTWELVYSPELIELGRNPNEIAQEGYMWSERILELEPVGTNDANIVWEWQIKDHYIQDFDSSKQGFGTIAEHPELFNINLPELNSSNSNSTRDWNHFNSIDYNESLDQILLSVRNSDEIWILDHSTTTQEAASHTGGQYGKGGDILYRWGNASAYNRGPVSDQKLFGQHGVHWIQAGLNDTGKILIFNNGNGRPGPDYSTAEILDPPQDSLGFYTQSPSEAFGPATAEIVYGDQGGEDFYSAYLSNAQRLKNGNTLINAGSPGRIFEVDPQRNQVWAYEIPLNGDNPASQGQNPNNNSNFRAYKFAPDFPGFTGIDLAPGNTIEFGMNPINCEPSSAIFKPDVLTPDVRITWMPESHAIRISNPDAQGLDLQVYHVAGRRVVHQTGNSAEIQISMHNHPPGSYLVRVASNGRIFSDLVFIFN
jgi:hypothetical protein